MGCTVSLHWKHHREQLENVEDLLLLLVSVTAALQLRS